MELTNNLELLLFAVLFELYMMSCINKALFDMVAKSLISGTRYIHFQCIPYDVCSLVAPAPSLSWVITIFPGQDRTIPS